MTRRHWALGCLLLACGGDPEPAPVTEVVAEPEVDPAPEPPAEVDPPAPPTDDPVPAPPAPAAPSPPTVTGPSPPPGQIPEAMWLDTEARERRTGPERSVTFPTVAHPDVAATLNARIEARARGLDARVKDLGDFGETFCEATLATRHLVSVLCIGSSTDERGMTTAEAEASHFAIDADGVRDFAVADAFAPGTDLDAFAQETCERGGGSELRCRETRTRHAITFDPDGVRVLPSWSEDIADGAVTPYAALGERLRRSGPLADSLDGHPLLSPGGPTTPRWAVLEADAVNSLAAWASLPEPLREGLRLAGRHLVAEDESAARAVATHLGTEPTLTPAPSRASAPLFVRVAREAPLLANGDRDALELRQLPRGTVLVTDRRPPDEARYAYAVVHGGQSGWVDARRLEVEEVCAPALEPFVESLPTSKRAAARRLTERNVLAQGGWGRATYVFEDETETHIALRRVGDGCAVERPLAAFTRSGPLRSLAMTRSASRGGEPLIVTVTSESVAVHRFGEREPAWTHDLASGDVVETSQREEDAWFPVVVRRADGVPVRLSWGEAGPRVE